MVDMTIKIYDATPLIKISTGEYPRFFPQVRADNPNVSFGVPGNISAMQRYDHDYVYPTEPPVVDRYTQKQPEEGHPEQWEDGTWHQVWETRLLTEEELAKNLKEEKGYLYEGAFNIYTADKAVGVKYTKNNVDYTVSTSDGEISLLLSLKSIVGSTEGADGIVYKFLDNTIVHLTNQEFLTMADIVFRSSYQVTRKYWEYIESVRTTDLVKDLPELPQTFRQ